MIYAIHMPRGEQYGPVRPGEGVSVDRLDLKPILDELRTGTYELDDSQQLVQEALDDPDTTKDQAKAVLNTPANKGFKIAFTGIIAEQIWPAYQTLATQEDAGIYTLDFDGNQAKLERQPEEVISGLPLQAVADMIAASNQAIMSYATCDFFGGGNVPVVCGNPKKDAAYFGAFRAQTDLQLSRTKHYFKTVPDELDSPTRFVTSGMQSVRTHVFGIPNLLDGVASREDIALTPDQHRTGVITTYNKAIVPYFYPTGPVMLAIDSEFANPETQQLLPERWVSNGNPDKIFVFPHPRIVRDANEVLAQRNDLPVRASCPVVHSQVTAPESANTAIPFTRALGQVLQWQLDALYYPKWHNL